MKRFALAALLFGLAACRSSSAITAASFCQDWVTALCMKNQTCCTDATGRYATLADCVSAQRASCALGEGTAFVNVPGRGQLAYFDPSGAQAALTDARNPDCTAMRPTLDMVSPVLVRGTLHTGDDCSPVGGDLSPTVACAPGYRCALGATRTGALNGECIPEGGPGALCYTQTCVAGYYCAIDAGASMGSCMVLQGPLASCFHDYECLTQVCTPNATDRTMPGACVGSTEQWCYPGAGLLMPTDGGTTGVDTGVPGVDLGP